MITLKLIAVLILLESVCALWQPDNGESREDWLRMSGMSEQEFNDVQAKKNELTALLLEKYTNRTSKTLIYNVNQGSSNQSSNHSASTCEVLLTSSQLTDILNSLKKEALTTTTGRGLGNRKKRYMVDLGKFKYYKWSLPITYKFDGTHSQSEQMKIRNATNHIMASTCVTFREIPTQEPFTQSHLLFSKQNGCYSFIGRVYNKSQIISIGAGCFNLGIIAHEINHALGANHEQKRPDRDNTIQVRLDYVDPTKVFNYALDSNGDTSLSPYDLNSVMHYPSRGFAINNQVVMLTRDARYQNNMGQLSGLSFYDAKLINHHYCSGKCSSALARPCQNGGYQDPLNCQACRCPDGLGGQFCETVAPSKNAICGGTIILNSLSSLQNIKSPGYDNPGNYDFSQECTWLIKTDPGSFINLQFLSTFYIYKVVDSCYHWVEVKYKMDKSLNGPRFCGNTVPTVNVKSEGNEMLVIFKSNFSLSSNRSLRGFWATVSLLTTSTNPTISTVTTRTTTTPVISKSTTTTSTTTTTTIKSTTLRTIPSTSTIKTSTPFKLSTSSKRVLWICSFESSDLCGMKQGNNDQFDWTRFTGPTPSLETGPDFAVNGTYYIYIEASSPRKANDIAEIYLPNLDYTGAACLQFYYHMYGSQIGSLNLITNTNPTNSTIFSRSKNLGNFWASERINIKYIGLNTEVKFKGVRGLDFTGDIALDYLYLTSGTC